MKGDGRRWLVNGLRPHTRYKFRIAPCYLGTNTKGDFTNLIVTTTRDLSWDKTKKIRGTMNFQMVIQSYN